jgi:hypothetical protein
MIFWGLRVDVKAGWKTRDAVSSVRHIGEDMMREILDWSKKEPVRSDSH